METINLCDNTDFSNKVEKGSRILGIDPGKKNVGISISDPNQKIATPLKIIVITLIFKQDKLARNRKNKDMTKL